MGDFYKVAVSETLKAGDDYFLNFRSTGINLSRNSVAQVALHFVLGHITVTAVDLDCIEAGLHSGFADVKFSHRSFTERMPPLALQPGRFVQQQSSGFQSH